jgi:hypothetical protein
MDPADFVPSFHGPIPPRDPEDPDNGQRADRAESALARHRELMGRPPDDPTDECDVSDLLTDAFHLCDRLGVEVGPAVITALRNWWIERNQKS